jgi:hypothetical protein
VRHAQTRSVSGTCKIEKCSPRSAAFPPPLRRRGFRLCSNDSSVLCRCVTPRRRARGPCGLSLRPPSCDYFRRRHPRGLPVLVYEVSRRVWGLRLRRTEQGLALSPLLMLPSVHYKDVGVRIASFRSSIPIPPIPLFTLRRAPHGTQRKTRGRADRSGRAMARTGLRMMPTFPSSPLKFRTVSFPQYGFKVGWSKGAFPALGVQSSRPSGLHPSFVPPAFKPVYPRAVSG